MSVTVRFNPLVDLGVQFDPSTLPASGTLLPLQTVRTGVILTNRGIETASSTALSAQYYLSADQKLDAGDQQVAKISAQLLNLAPGAAAEYYANLTIPAGTPLGNYYLIAVVSPGIAVTDPSHNIATSGPIQVIGPTLSASFDNSAMPENGAVMAGDTLNTSLIVSNGGSGPATGAMVIDYYLSSAPELGSTDSLIEEIPEALNLTPGDSAAFSASLTLPAAQFGSTYYLLAKISAGSQIAQSSPSAPLRLFPKVLNVVTHGFGNYFLPHSSFKQQWDTLRNTLDDTIPAGSVLQNNVETYEADWQSSWGWISAAAATVAEAYEGSQGNALLAAGFEKLRQAAMAEASAEAVNEAYTIFTALTDPSSPYYSDPALTKRDVDPQIIHLIGHSRGAAVNALLAALLARAGYRIDQYTSLDGYSTDWPGLGGLLGDIPITQELASAGSQVAHVVNYEVQQGLAPLLLGWVQQYTQLIAPGFAFSVGVAEPLLLSILGQWKAPDRSFPQPGPAVGGVSGSQNQVLVGPPGSVASNHVNIVGYYTSSQAFPPGQQYILYNYEGQNRNAAPATGPVAASAEAPTTSMGSAESLAVSASPTPLPGSDFSYGSCDQLIAEAQSLGAALSQAASSTSDPSLAQFLSAVVGDAGSPSFFWLTTGDPHGISTALDGSRYAYWLNAGATQSGPSVTSMGQPIVLDGSQASVDFDMDVLGINALNLGGMGVPLHDALQVLWNDAVVATIPLIGIPRGIKHYSIPIGGLGEGEGNMMFTLVGTAGPSVPDVITLNNFAIVKRPVVISASFGYDRSPVTLSVTFSKPVAIPSSGGLQVRDLSTGVTIFASGLSYDPTTNVATFVFSTELADGDYEATLSATAVADNAGNGLARDYVFRFFSLAGDLNRDGAVDFKDLVILAQNYGKTTATYVQGDLNHDGVVSFADLVMLAQQYGRSVPTVAAPSGRAFNTLRAVATRAAAISNAKMMVGQNPHVAEAHLFGWNDLATRRLLRSDVYGGHPIAALRAILRAWAWLGIGPLKRSEDHATPN